jgi:hypothetical protein
METSIVCRTGRVAITTIAFGLLLSACSSATNLTDMGSPLHNEADFKTATTAKETSDAIDYLKPIKEERANQARLLEHELGVVRAFAIARRNAGLMALLNDDPEAPLSSNISTGAETRLALVVGTTYPALKDMTIDQLWKSSADPLCGGILTLSGGESAEAVGKLLQILSIRANKCEERLQTKQRYFTYQAGYSGPSCPLSGTIPAFKKDDREEALAKFKKARPTSRFSDDEIAKLVEDAHADLVATCFIVRSNQRGIENLIVGCEGGECFDGATGSVRGLSSESLIAETVKDLREARKDRDAALAAARQALADYASAVKKYEAAAAANLDAPGDATQQKVDEATKEVREALKLLQEAGDAIGAEMAASEQIAKIDRLLQAAGTGEIDAEAVKNDQELAGALAAANALPSFADRVEFIQGRVNPPPLSSLILEKARLQAIAADAKRVVERRSQAIALLEAKRDAIIREAGLHTDALGQIRIATKAGAITTEQLVQHSVTERRREDLVVGLERYLSSFTGPRQQLHELTYREIALMHDEAVDKSETSLQIWKATIQTPVDALVAYHGSGLKPEDLIELLKAIGIGAIAGGVL